VVAETLVFPEGGTQRPLPFWNQIRDSWSMAETMAAHWRSQIARRQA
jgi:hypothetical protein